MNNLIKNPVKTLLESAEFNAEPPSPLPSPPQQQQQQQQQQNKQQSTTSRTEAPSGNDGKKEKIKEMIEFQKQRHERRIKALEKLTKLERLQAEKLRKILQLNQSELDSSSSLITSQMYDMLIQTNNSSQFPDKLDTESNIGNETIIDLDEAFKDENISIVIDEKNANNHLKQADNNSSKPPLSSNSTAAAALKQNNRKLKFIDEINESYANEFNQTAEQRSLKSSKVEILNLKNTSVHDPFQRGVVVVKEKSAAQNEFDNRYFVSVPADTKPAKQFKSNQAHLKQPPYFSFYSMNNNNNNNNDNKENMLMTVKETKKLSLQEAFETHKYDLISRSRQRQKEIQFRAEQRQKELEFEAVQIENYHKRMKNQQLMNRNLLVLKKKTSDELRMKKLNKQGLMFEINVDNFMHKRQMTQQDIKKQTRRLYEKLPEVKQKQLKQRAEELKRANRLKSSIYRKTLQQRVLTRGPNFNLREAFVT